MEGSKRRVGLLFAGQGAQFVGMGEDLVDEFGVAEDLFEEAEEALGPELVRVMFEGPEERLTRTDVSQPAVFLHSFAVYRVLVEEELLQEGEIVGAAGLSLGEYTALAAAGVMEFRDALMLVRRRGELMQTACEASPGTMASVLGLDEDDCREVCREVSEETGGVVVVANVNSPGQVVISGEPEAVEKAGEVLKARGARRIVPLKVAGAFHSPLMQDAADGLKMAFDSVSLQAPRFPVVMNVTSEPVGDAAEVPGLCERQLTGTVRFADCLRTLHDMGVEEFWEIGPGKVLSGLARRTVSGVPVRSIGTAEDVEKLEEEMKDAG